MLMLDMSKYAWVMVHTVCIPRGDRPADVNPRVYDLP